jgi:hypothetical protein
MSANRGTCVWREGCESGAHSRRLCGKHYATAVRDGLLDQYPKIPRAQQQQSLRRRPVGERYVNRHGYAWVVTEVGPLAEHRIVMEQVLGRPLRPGESVHHINGVRADNRPENLELWCSPPRFGQRAADLIAFIADAYPTEVAEFVKTGQLPLLAFGRPTQPTVQMNGPESEDA